MKHIRLLAALFCCVATLALPVTPTLPAEAAEVQTQDDFLYDVITDRDTGYSYVQINGYTGNEEGLTIPAAIDGVPVEYIASLAGGKCPERLVIPEGVRVIGSLFGENSEALKEVVLPCTLKVIGGNAQSYLTSVFAHAEVLTTLTVPYSVSLICEDSFSDTLTLLVEAGSYAHRWAKANGQPFEVIQHTPSVGDYDADGLTTSTDARLLLQQVAGKVTFSEAQAAVADVDGDGEVTTTDARLTLQYATGKEAVESLICLLTFDSPLIPPEAAEGMTASISEDPLLYTRAPGPLKSPVKMVQYVNERIRQEYYARFQAEPNMFVPGARIRMQMHGVAAGVDYRLWYYGLSLTLSLDSRFSELIME